MAEINNFSKVAPNDYKNLILLKSCIEINYARLKSCDLESEISNTQTIMSIEAKLPSTVKQDWIKEIICECYEKKI